MTQEDTEASPPPEAHKPAAVNRLLRHSSIYAAGNIINRVGAFLLLPLYTNYLSVSDYGALELFYTISSIVSGLLSVGISHATLRFYFDYDSLEARHSLVRTSYFAILALGIAGSLVVMLFSKSITTLFFHSNAYTWGIPLILCTMIFELGSQVCLAYLRAIERSTFFVVIAIAKLLLQVALNWVLVSRLHAGVEGVLLGNLAAVVTGWAILSSFTLKQCGIGFDWAKLIPVLRYCAPFLFSTLVALVAGNADRALLSSRLSIAALGIYALAGKFAQLVTELVGEPFNRSYGGLRFSIMDKPGAQSTQEKITRYFVAGLVAIGLGIALFSRDVLVIASNPAYWPAADYVPVLVLVAILRAVIYPFQTGILYGKRTGSLFYIKTVGTILNIALNFALIGSLGIAGACLAALASAALEVALTDRASQRFFPVTYQWRRIWVSVGLGAAFYAISLTLVNLTLTWSIALKGLLWLSFVAALICSPALQPDESAKLRAGVKQHGSGVFVSIRRRFS